MSARAAFTRMWLPQRAAHSGILSGGGVFVVAGGVDFEGGLEVVDDADCEAGAAVDEVGAVLPAVGGLEAVAGGLEVVEADRE